MLTATTTVLFSVAVIQWVTSSDGPSSAASSKHDSHELGSQHGNGTDGTSPNSRHFGSGGVRRNVSVGDNLEEDEFGTVGTDNGRPHSRGSSRRELASAEAMISVVTDRHVRSASGSTDTLPSGKPFGVQITAKSAPTGKGDKQEGMLGVDLAQVDLTAPEEVRVRGSNLHVTRIWGPGS